MMKNESISDNVVAPVRYRPDTNPLPQALDLCRGLQGIPANTEILNKPKSISWGDTTQSLNLIQKFFLKGENNGIQDY